MRKPLLDFMSTMKVAIVGASASGIYLALSLLSRHPSWKVVLFDQEAKFGKKIAATGNGRCNILHDQPSPERYSDPEWFASSLQKVPFHVLKSTLEEWGIPLRKEGELYYPLSNSAPSLVRYLGQSLKSLGAKLSLSTKVLDYRPTRDSVSVTTSQGKEDFDYVVFASGGASGKNLGSDGSLFSTFSRHGYSIVPLRPGLSPIKTQKADPSLAGLRVDAKVISHTVSASFEEEGQVLFKKDGLSGIVIFNLESFLVRHGAKRGALVTLDLFPNKTEEELVSALKRDAKRPHFLSAYFPEALANHFLAEFRSNGCQGLAHKLKHWDFSFEEPYGFEDSQVTIGGVSRLDVDASFASKKEPRVSFIGECLNMDADCGGYNLTWCLLSALIAAEGIHEILR